MTENGSVVLQAIKELERPSTIQAIASHIATKSGVEVSEELTETVSSTLEGGLLYGFLQAKDGEYFVLPHNADTVLTVGSVEPEEPLETEETHEQADQAETSDGEDMPIQEASRGRSSSRRRRSGSSQGSGSGVRSRTRSRSSRRR